MNQTKHFKRTAFNLSAKSMVGTLLLFIAMLVPQGAWADNQTLVLWLKNGQKVYYALSDEPHTTFKSGMLVISSNRIHSEYHLSEVLRYTFDGEFTGIDTAVEAGTGFRQSGDELDIYGLAEGTEAKLYSTNGVLLDEQNASNSRSIHFTLANQPAGVYLVKIGEQTLKFMKR